MPHPRKDSGGPLAQEPLLKRMMGRMELVGVGRIHRRDTTGSQEYMEKYVLILALDNEVSWAFLLS